MSEAMSELLGLINGLTEKECAAALDILKTAGFENTRGKLTVKEFAIEEIMRPHCCTNCEFNSMEQRCCCGDETDGHEYGHQIKNTNDVCTAWMPDADNWTYAYTALKE